MTNIPTPKTSWAVVASPWDAAIAIGFLVILMLPTILERPTAAAPLPVVASASDLSALKTEAVGFHGYRSLVTYVAARSVAASETDRADLEGLQMMLAGYRELHGQVDAMIRAGDTDRAAAHARLANAVREEIISSLAAIGSQSIGTDESAPVPAAAPQTMRVAMGPN
jgi:hypothetical protein